MRRSIFRTILSVSLVAVIGCSTPMDDNSSDKTITLLAIPGVIAPARGAVPETSAIDTAQYSGTVTWSPNDNPFAASTVYTASIALKPKSGWTANGVAANAFTVAGATATNAADSGSVSAVFPATGSLPTETPKDQAITLFAIPGVTAPARGAVPVTTAIDTTQYTGTISWSPNDGTFKPLTAYTARITLTPKAGWTLAGVTANCLTVAGAKASNAADSGEVTAEFPVTPLLEMIAVPAGKFQFEYAKSPYVGAVSAFRMSECEITRAQFLAIMGADPSDTGVSPGQDYPAQYITWYNALAFCNKLSLAEGLTPVYENTDVVDWRTLLFTDIPKTYNSTWGATKTVPGANGYRLPTEMEWMWAAMGAPADGQNGGTNANGYKKAFAGSDGSNVADIKKYAWYTSYWDDGSASKQTTNPVGTLLPNELGLHDMSGNVYEWCWDGYSDTFPTPIPEDYQGDSSLYERVVHGGAYNSGKEGMTVLYRSNMNQTQYFNQIGFRVVR